MSRLRKNIFYNLAGKILVLVLSFVAVKYIFGRLGEDALGLIFFTAALNALLATVLNMGVIQTSTREVSSHYHDDPQYIKHLIRTGSLFYWGLYVLLGVLIYFAAPILIHHWVNLKSMDMTTGIHILRVLGIASLVALPKAFYASLFKGLERMEFNNAIDVGMSALRQLGVVVILTFENSTLFHAIYWLALGYVIEIFVYQVFLLRFCPITWLLPGFSTAVLKRNFGFASNMTLITILWSIHEKTDKAVISKLMPVGVLGYYSFAQRAVALGALLTSSINTAAFPALSSLHRKKDNGLFLSQYKKLHDLICFGNVPILAFVAFAALPVFSYVLNPEAGEMLKLPTILLCIASFMNGTLRTPITASFAVGKPQISRNMNFYSLFLVVPLTVVLVKSFGLVGASLAIISRMMFFYAYAIPRICHQCLKISVFDWYWQVLRVLILSGLTYGVAWIVLSVLGSFSILSLACGYVAASIFFATLSYSMIGQELKYALSGQFLLAKRKILKAA